MRRRFMSHAGAEIPSCTRVCMECVQYYYGVGSAQELWRERERETRTDIYRECVCTHASFFTREQRESICMHYCCCSLRPPPAAYCSHSAAFISSFISFLLYSSGRLSQSIFVPEFYSRSLFFFIVFPRCARSFVLRTYQSCADCCCCCCYGYSSDQSSALSL